MKLMRVGSPGEEGPAILDDDGLIKDLSELIPDIGSDRLSKEWIGKLRSIDTSSLPTLNSDIRIGPCVARPTNFIGIGLNYVDHAREADLAIPSEPIVFLKSLGALSGPYDNVRIPRGSRKTDWEVELGVVIGEKASYVSEADALDHVAGYCVVNDVSEREFQSERGGTWDKGKGCDTFGPIGPWLVTRDEISDPQCLRLWLDVDGRRMQDGNTSNMIFPVAKIISYLSGFFTLYPGDIIATGTPAGVGLGHRPNPIFLSPGQVMALGIDGLGQQTQRVVA